MPHAIAVLVGSLRKDSYTRKVARAIAELSPPSLTFDFVEIGDLAHYNADLEAAPPPEWTRFRDEIRPVDGVLFATPEYNRSVPGVLKNAIDVGSRPYGKSVWAGKPAGVVSVSPGKIGAFGANQHLRQTFVFLDMPVMQQPEAYISGADKMFDADGKLIDDTARGFFTKFSAAFAAWVAHHPKR